MKVLILFHFIGFRFLLLLFVLLCVLFCVCQWSKKTRLAALIILALVSLKTDFTTSSYEGVNSLSFYLFSFSVVFIRFMCFFHVCQWSKKTRLVVLLILAPLSLKTDSTTSSYEGFNSLSFYSFLLSVVFIWLFHVFFVSANLV